MVFGTIRVDTTDERRGVQNIINMQRDILIAVRILGVQNIINMQRDFLTKLHVFFDQITRVFCSNTFFPQIQIPKKIFKKKFRKIE